MYACVYIYLHTVTQSVCLAILCTCAYGPTCMYMYNMCVYLSVCLSVYVYRYMCVYNYVCLSKSITDSMQACAHVCIIETLSPITEVYLPIPYMYLD